jgi:hypothetical protein
LTSQRHGRSSWHLIESDIPEPTELNRIDGNFGSLALSIQPCTHKYGIRISERHIASSRWKDKGDHSEKKDKRRSSPMYNHRNAAEHASASKLSEDTAKLHSSDSLKEKLWPTMKRLQQRGHFRVLEP